MQTMQAEKLIETLYQVSRQLFVPVIRQFIVDNLHSNHCFLTTDIAISVNA